MYRKEVTTTGLVIVAIVMAVSLITASSGGIGLVTSAFAVKKGGSSKSDTSSSGSSGSSTSKKGTSDTSGTSTGSKSKFIKCVTAISGSSPSRSEVDNCWDQVFGSGSSSSSSGLTLDGSGSTLGGGSSSSGRSSSGPPGHGGTSS